MDGTPVLWIGFDGATVSVEAPRALTRLVAGSFCLPAQPNGVTCSGDRWIQVNDGDRGERWMASREGLQERARLWSKALDEQGATSRICGDLMAILILVVFQRGCAPLRTTRLLPSWPAAGQACGAAAEAGGRTQHAVLAPSGARARA